MITQLMSDEAVNAVTPYEPLPFLEIYNEKFTISSVIAEFWYSRKSTMESTPALFFCCP